MYNLIVVVLQVWMPEGSCLGLFWPRGWVWALLWSERKGSSRAPLFL